MRAAGLAALQQTLTAEAAAVVARAAGDATRRRHAQITPLHVASALLAAAPPNQAALLQQACLRSHPHLLNHPLQCRALELCFNVALDRLPCAASAAAAAIPSSSAVASSSSSRGTPESRDPALSNALVAALKRAQAQQRRGCPEQQQVPLLAVKVEMEQLIISILDDPSVSRVMREAGFSSTNAKAALEGMIASPPPQRSPPPPHPLPPPLSCKSRVSGRDVDAALAILCRHARRRNPVIIAADEVVAEVAAAECIVRFEKEHQREQVRVLGLTEVCSSRSGERWRGAQALCIVVDMGNLAWTLEPQRGIATMMELSRLLAMENGEQKRRLWCVGFASSQTYTRFLAQHPAMETTLGLQPLPISDRPRFSGIDKQRGGLPSQARILPKMPFMILEEPSPEELYCCADCSAKFEQESVHLQEQVLKAESVQSSSLESLPLWLNKAAQRPSRRTEAQRDQLLEIRKKWSRICHLVHSTTSSKNNNNSTPTLPYLLNDSNSSSSQTSSADHTDDSSKFGSKPAAAAAAAAPWLSLSTVPPDVGTTQAGRDDKASLSLAVVNSSSNKSVLTDLSLGSSSRPGVRPAKESEEAPQRDREQQQQQQQKSLRSRQLVFEGDEASAFKALCAKLSAAVPGQSEAATSVAAAVTKCRRRSAMWLVFSGGDKMGKRRMAKELAKQIAGDRFAAVSLSGAPPGCCKNTSSYNSSSSSSSRSRGWTTSDRVVDAVVRQRGSGVVLLEDAECADATMKKLIVRAKEQGVVADSSGREVSLGSCIVILCCNSRKKNSSAAAEEIAGLEDRLLGMMMMQQQEEQEGCCSNLRLEQATLQRQQQQQRFGVWIADDDDEDEDDGCAGRRRQRRRLAPASDGEGEASEEQGGEKRRRKRKRRWRGAVAAALRKGGEGELDLRLGLAAPLAPTGRRRGMWREEAAPEWILCGADEEAGFEEYDYVGAAAAAMAAVETAVEEASAEGAGSSHEGGVCVEVARSSLEAMVAALWGRGEAGFGEWVRSWLSPALRSSCGRWLLLRAC